MSGEGSVSVTINIKTDCTSSQPRGGDSVNTVVSDILFITELSVVLQYYACSVVLAYFLRFST